MNSGVIGDMPSACEDASSTCHCRLFKTCPQPAITYPGGWHLFRKIGRYCIHFLLSTQTTIFVVFFFYLNAHDTSTTRYTYTYYNISYLIYFVSYMFLDALVGESNNSIYRIRTDTCMLKEKMNELIIR